MLRTQALSKHFGGQPVLRSVTVEFRPGEVHALMGENGAGKSTLMKTLAGLHQPDEGTVFLRDEEVSFASPHEALGRGIAMIHQELMPLGELSVAENILLGCEPVGRLGLVDREAMRRRAAELLAQLESGIDPAARMGSLSVAETQVVEIAKALNRRADVLMMDEPTAALSDHETAALFRVIGRLRAQGVAVVYTTHKMDEVFRIADRISVLRDGQLVGTAPAAEMTPAGLIALMVGRELTAAQASAAPTDGEVVLEVRDLSDGRAYRDISFRLRRGEILGLAGLMGAGRTEVASALYGLRPASSGEILLRGQPVRIRSPRDAIAAGIGMVTEDRKGLGIIPDLSLRANITLASLRRLSHGALIRHDEEARVATGQIATYAIRASGPEQPVRELSGGNQQKALLARCLLNNPDLVILDEPTRGIDIGAKTEVYALIRRLADSGKAVLLISSELPEVLALTHRILVLRQGRISAELTTAATSQEEVIRHAMPL